jgi:squalene-hopene/tetraprenyl-beta-curcumene cyclase
MQSVTDDAYQSVFGPAAPVALPPPTAARVAGALASASRWLLARQTQAGWWCGDLEGDTTLESYLVLLYAFLDRRADPRVAALAARIRERALPGGGFSAYLGGPAELSVSCLSYFALKVAGESADAPHMRLARDAIRALGGPARAGSYARYHLAMFGQCGWGDVPAIPPEIIFLPGGGPFSVYDMSSWSRTIFVPLSIIYASKPVVRLPAALGVAELWRDGNGDGNGDGDGAAGDRADGVDAAARRWRRFFGLVDRGLKRGEKLPPSALLRELALRRAAAWMIERLADSDGLGAILPAMTSSVIALKCLGYRDDSALVETGMAELERLFTRRNTSGLRVQPCLSPVWDTCLAASALLQAGTDPGDPALRRAASWLLERQSRRRGDWALKNPAAPGGWAFEFRNDFYPDVDDTAMALMVLRQVGPNDTPDMRAAIDRGQAWMLGMQNQDGGWASFDRGNDKQWLTHVPFADHNAMIDPSTPDITGRVLESLSRAGGFDPLHPVVQRALAFLRADQCADGSWFGRWGVNYIYGTWQVLRGLRCIGEDMERAYVRRAARWLTAHQRPDGGWGESIASYDDPAHKGIGVSTPSQTAWAVMGLIAAHEANSTPVRAGIRYLLEHQTGEGTWEQEAWTGTGFPRVFYLNYEYYRHYFPLMALGQYAGAV